MRIKLSNSKLFFDEIISLRNVSLKQLSKDLNLNYSNLKQYRRGEKTLSLEVFNLFIDLSPRKEFWLIDKK